MRPEQINISSRWEQFMKLSNEARMRNRGLSAEARQIKPQEAVEHTQQRSSPVMEKLPERKETNTVNRAFIAPQPVSLGKILGGRFDAYA